MTHGPTYEELRDAGEHRAAALAALRDQRRLATFDQVQPKLRNAAIVHALLYVGDCLKDWSGR